MKMDLPQSAEHCLLLLEQAGFPAYAVGGCVRDACLGLKAQDYDLCTAALPEQIQQVFRDSPMDLTGVRHGTVRVGPLGNTVEITTFRREGSYRDNRHPEWVEFVEDIESDLGRRDFTVNAMAWSPVRGLCDPFGGVQDLEKKILRTVGDPAVRFREDALRILRGLRFAARFHLQVEEKTLEAMISQTELLKNLSRERVMEELSGALPYLDAAYLAEFAPVLSAVIPELGPMVGFDQHSPHHAYDLYTHTALVTQQVPGDLNLRWAALLHDIGKVPTFTRDENGRGHFYGHAPAGAKMARQVLERLKAPAELREQAVTLIGEHMTPLRSDRASLHRRISTLGWETAEKLYYLQKADLMSKGTDTPEDRAHFDRVRSAMDALKRDHACMSLSELQITGRDLMELGYAGKAIGECLQSLFSEVLDEKLPNDREALLSAAKAGNKNG